MLNIDYILKSKRLTKKEVARRMGLTRESVHRILSGNPTLENINKLAAALEVPVSELFEPPAIDVLTCPHCGGKIKVVKE